MQAKLDTDEVQRSLMLSIQVKKDKMNKFHVAKDVVSICGGFMEEKIRKHWFAIMIEAATAVIEDE